ncbi:hypothetical protein SSX86_016175 [Deinandra increscens subsp. villosa]|uniref:ZF-HD dimerization-type domain-containing protein n=1 Tax=Deinandra increscens subsp. villosa TaxID=3103831 RepID=A0AAP0D4Z2_9ASTR
MTKIRVVLKREEPPSTNSANSSNTMGVHVRYGECQRNHAANVGGYAVDGCREFMAQREEEEGTEASLTCAACGCHRNFHRRVVENDQEGTNVALDVLKKDDVSAAMFAPGWVCETKQPPDFQTAQNRITFQGYSWAGEIGLKNYAPQKDKLFSGTVKLPHIPCPKLKVCMLGDAQHVEEISMSLLPDPVLAADENHSFCWELSSDSMHIGILAAATHAASNNSLFPFYYNPSTR